MPVFPTASPQTLYLGGNGSLSTSPSAADSASSFVYDPVNPLATLVGCVHYFAAAPLASGPLGFEHFFVLGECQVVRLSGMPP